MPVRPRPIVVALFLALVLAGCSAPGGGFDDPGPTRTVTATRGPVEVPAAPTRVVVLEPVALDTAVALGVVPVGAAVLGETAGVPAYLGDAARRATVVGTIAEPSPERVAALDPDLVIGTETRHARLYDQLSAIAPTVFLGSQADPWQDSTRLVGRVLGREGETEALLAGYRGRCAEVARARATGGRTAQLIRPRGGQLTLYGPTSFAGSTLECAGLAIPPRDWQRSISIDVSAERATTAQADDVFVTVADPASPAPLPPAVTGLGPAALGRLHVVDQSVWITGVGPLGGRRVLDDIERLLGP